MAIRPEDVKLYEPQRMTDESDGGGRATGNVIEDGVVNNLFPDVSRIDRTSGDVAMRKYFVGVDTDNQDSYLGVHAIISEDAEDENVSVLLFDAGDESDQRSDAQNRVESYVVPGAAAPWDLQGNQYAGQRAIVGFQIKEARIPEIGEVYLLRDVVAGNEQYVRIADIDHEIMPYTIAAGGGYQTFERRRLDISLTSVLEHNFPGSDVRPSGAVGDHTEVLTTKIADAARYWGISNSVQSVTSGQTGIYVNDVYKPIVPSARKESAVLDQETALDSYQLVKSTASPSTTSFGIAFYGVQDGVGVGYLPCAVEPGSLFLQIMNRATFEDNGDGTMTATGSSLPGAKVTINYKDGVITVVDDWFSAGTVLNAGRYQICHFTPASVMVGRVLTAAEPVDNANRVQTFTRTFPEAKPSPGTFVFSYRALGKWYEIKDEGIGNLQGAGVGSIDFQTGTVNITTEALPDPDSQILWSYLPDEKTTTTVLGYSSASNRQVVIDLPDDVQPGTVQISYTISTTEYIVTDSASVGVLASANGGGSGTVDYAEGKARFTPKDNTLNNFVPYLSLTQSGGDSSTVPMSSYSAGVLSGTIPDAPIRPGSVSITALVNVSKLGTITVEERLFVDDGVGGWLLGGSDRSVSAVGTVDYSTGVFSLGVGGTKQGFRIKYGWKDTAAGKKWGSIAENYDIVTTPAGDAVVRYQQTSSATTSVAAHSVDFNTELTVDPGAGGKILPGSLVVDVVSHYHRIFDRDGVIYKNFSHLTGSGTAIGEIDYSTGLITLTDNMNNSLVNNNVIAGISVDASKQVDHVAFRTPGAPLNPGSVSITFTDVEGNIINETANVAGQISGSKVQGTVDYQTGLVDLTFTDGADPVYVFPESGRYNAIIITALPLDANLIGLDPVRLPSDGRVPIYREGDICVIHHKAESVVTPSANLVVNVGRTNIASAWVEDSNNKKLNPAAYTVDKAAGTLTFADPLTLEDAGGNALTAPFKVFNRIEHMSMINGVDVTGHISFIAPSGHDFPANETLVSSAKVWGDINSRYFNFFKQRTWSSGSPNWTDSRVGDDTAAAYNDVDNPIEIANRGAVTEKWAIVFTGSTTFQVVGSELGIIATGNTSTDLMPVNLNTGFPYFIVRAAGWGAGWAAGNVLRFDTEGCLAPGWICRTVLSGQGTIENDKFNLQIRGDAE